jgi:hypothetical protein
MRVLFTQADLSIVEFPPGNPSSGFPPPLLDRDQFGVTQHSRIGIAGPDGPGRAYYPEWLHRLLLRPAGPSSLSPVHSSIGALTKGGTPCGSVTFGER